MELYTLHFYGAWYYCNYSFWNKNFLELLKEKINERNRKDDKGDIGIMRCCSCKYRPMLDSRDIDETYPDVCGLVNENEVTEYLYQGRYEIGCKFNQKTLDKRKQKLDNFYNNYNEYYG